MRIHLIAIGGSVMHNLALALHYNHHTVSGSDDEVYNPAKDRLDEFGLLPKKIGWDENRITKDLDAVILGMHARPDNPELKKAADLGVPIYSFPEFIYEHSKDKKRVVVAGSHGKTTTTSMIMHVLKYCDYQFDYLVGAQLEGFERMVQLSDAPLIILEGDEYLSSPIDRRPKFLHYTPHITILTGIAWDHINVFPTFGNYLEQFELLLKNIKKDGSLIFFKHDKHIQRLLKKPTEAFVAQPYEQFQTIIKDGITLIKRRGKSAIPLHIFGAHNLANLKAAHLALKEIGVSDELFFEAIQTFQGAAKRLERLAENENCIVWKDFAHAPSKVKASIEAAKAQYADRQLIACLELHTFSSLNKAFLPEYEDTMNKADLAIVYFNEHTLAMKKLPPLTEEEIKTHFQHFNLHVFTEREKMEAFLMANKSTMSNLLLMSSGNFGGIDYKGFGQSFSSPSI